MLHSMTAFARAEIEHEGGRLSWELKSVNHRYLEASFKLPEAFRPLEAELRDTLKSKLQRGKLDANLNFNHQASDSTAIEVNEAKVLELLRASDTIAELAGLSTIAPLSPMQFLSWPGVIAEQSSENASLLEAGRALFAEAISELVGARAREGEQLTGLLQQRLHAIQVIVQDAREQLPAALQEKQARLADKVAELQENCEPLRLEQELVLIANKADTSEELDRLESHVQEVERVITQAGPCGRRLDFLMQELNREANTLSAKSISSALSRAAVELKVLIEQMREQVQNIE